MGLGLFGNGAVIVGVHVNLVTQTINLDFQCFVFAVIVILVFYCISGTTLFVSVVVGTLFR